MKRLFKLTGTPSPKPAPPKSKPSLSTTTPAHPGSLSNTTGLEPKYIVPPVPHPNPHHHLEILVSSKGLLLRPHVPGYHHTGPYVKISWGLAGKVELVEDAAAKDPELDWTKAAVVYGILGSLDLFTASYLLVISSRTELGNFLDKDRPVYAVKTVHAVPLSEERAIVAVNGLLSRNRNNPRTSLLPTTDDDAGAQDSPAQPPTPARAVKFAEGEEIKVMTPTGAQEDSFFAGLQYNTTHSPSPSSGRSSPSSELSQTGPVERIVTNRLAFWNRFSKRGKPDEFSDSYPVDDSDSLDAIMAHGRQEPAEVLGDIIAATAPAPITQEETHNQLEDKIVRETIREFSKGGMYFAYNFDITRCLQHKRDQVCKANKHSALLEDLKISEGDPPPGSSKDGVDPLVEPSPMLPLWRRVDKQFWWNEWLSKLFIDAGLHGYILPVMQGYFQIASFDVPPMNGEPDELVPVDYIVISRRSRDRAGLRYQRRGVGEEGNVANFVETESVVRVQREGLTNVFSYVQLRGSIPLYWNQGGYGLKPPPQLSSERTPRQHAEALRKHFNKIVPKYGPQSVVNLAELGGREGVLSQAYNKHATEWNSPDVSYCDYDFHAETRGMKYENIGKLVAKQEHTFERQAYLWISNNNLMSEQKGVFRVNCIDCLDRTNVVQSAFARYVLNRQLGALALYNPEETHPECDTVFNDMWANNGDAISRAYAGTSALKGDFTRTGRRDLTGMLNDGVNSLARMYTSTFSDWFSQAVIDYMLGNRNLSVFSEFLLKLQSSDPRDLIRLSRIRAEAIATSVSRVLSEGERLLCGWTVFSPSELNLKFSDKFEEKVLLLTRTAIYIVSYDYTLEKVKIYTRVPLGDIIQITKGAYILSPLEEASKDPLQNAGFALSWSPTKQTARMTSYSIRNSIDMSRSPPSTPTNRTSFSAPISTSPKRKGTGMQLSGLLSRAAEPAQASDKVFSAFKVLPIDPARSRRATGSIIEPADELSGAKNCKEAVDLMVESIVKACEDVGGGCRSNFVVEEAVVSLAEANRNTTMYAKMEYGVKRLLWLGGY